MHSTMQKTAFNRICAICLILCMLLAMFPAVMITAEAATASVSSESELRNAIEGAGSGSSVTVNLTGNINVTTTIQMPDRQNLTINGNGNSITAVGSAFQNTGSGANFCLLYGPACSGGRSLTLNNVTLNANQKTKVLYMCGNLTMTGCTIKGGRVEALGGAGVQLIEKASVDSSTHRVKISNCVFEDNAATKNTYSSGGAIYFEPGNEAEITGCTFRGNSAHSGGAIYAYQSVVTIDSSTSFENNSAGQRGGAIHSHGTVYLNGTKFSGNSSGQYGGTIYVSANVTSDGVLQAGTVVLKDINIEGSTAGNSGGAVYIAENGELQVEGNTKIRNNHLSSGSAPNPYDEDNVFVASSNSRIAVRGKLTSGKAAIGVSTGNPYTEKDLVFSTSETDSSGRIGLTPSSYKMSSDASNYESFKYDGEGWSLLKNTKNPDRMWLMTTAAGTTGTVVFNSNVPGKEAKVEYMRDIGATLNVPSISTLNVGDVTFTFKGWYDAPEGGTKVDGTTVSVVAGVKTYYAQWDLSGGSGGGGAGGKGDMYLVYFDYNYEGGGVMAAYSAAGTFTWTVTDEETGESETFSATLPFGFPEAPYRPGYTFGGWATSPTSKSPVGNNWTPTKTDTLYAIWTAAKHTLTWNANGGNGGTTTTQDFDSVITPPATKPTRTGYDFDDWYLDSGCTVKLTSGTTVTGNQTFYAKWVPKEYNITWDTNYTGGSVTTIPQKYDEALTIPGDPVREGYAFAGWFTQPNGGGTQAQNYGNVTKNETLYACWTQEVTDYKVQITWNDQSNNDNVRPDSVKVVLTRNDTETNYSYTLTAKDATDYNTWSYTFQNLPKNDPVSNEYKWAVQIDSSIPATYSCSLDNTASSIGHVILTHTLITRDVNAYVVWDDNMDKDGFRPASVNVQLYANGTPMQDAEASTTLSGDGSTWTYTFENVQKYYDDGNIKGKEIEYTILVSETAQGGLKEYTVSYNDYTAILKHTPKTVDKTVLVEWKDNNNQDGKRPTSMTVQLYANNVPVQGKYVILSDANKWTYTWKNLERYTDQGVPIVYSAHVTSTLVDYTSATTEMTIEMTYVPSSTTITAFATWEDAQDVDGLRPENVTAELYKNGKATGDKQVMSTANGWTVSWSNYPVYENGSRIEYTFKIVNVPDGYTDEYLGIYDTSGLSVVLKHERLLDDYTVRIIWDDLDNAALARPAKVKIMLYADGVALTDKTAILSENTGWQYTFEDLYVREDNGREIKYSAYVDSDIGEYVPYTDGLTVTLSHDVETVDVPLFLIWDDKDNRDGTRPVFVVCTLTIDGEPTKYAAMATVESGWSVVFQGLAKYASSNKGQTVNYGVIVTPPAGYTATYAGTQCGLTATSATVSKTLHITWRDNNDQYAQRPSKVTVTLLANGESTGKQQKVYAADGWICEAFTDLPRYSDGREIIYSIAVSGDIGNYTTLIDGMDAYLTHKSYEDSTSTSYNAKVIWNDNLNELNSREYGMSLTLYANDAPYQAYVLTSSDIQGDYTWNHEFTGLPTKLDGKDVVYTIGMDAPKHYTAAISNDTVILTHVQDIDITVNWEDSKNDDGRRPDSLTLELVGDGLPTGDAGTVQGDMEADTWLFHFEDVPVWSSTNTSHEIKYTYRVSTDGQQELTAAGYQLDYRDFEQEAGSMAGNKLLMSLNVSRNLDVADYGATIRWDDGNDRDGLRPERVTVKLLADYGDDGKGPVDTRITADMSGNGNTWSYTFKNLLVRKNQGKDIIYTIAPVVTPDGYTADRAGDKPDMELIHEPAQHNVSATVSWDDASNVNGLQRTDLYVELTVDGKATGEIGRLSDSNNYTATWNNLYTYHDHGTAYAYSFVVSSQSLAALPEGVEVLINGMDGIVRQTSFSASGTVSDPVGFAVDGANVSIYDSRNAFLLSVMTESDGSWNVSGLPNGSYTARVTYTGTTTLTGTEGFIIDRTNASGVDITLEDKGNEGDDKYTYSVSGTVVNSNGGNAANAQIFIWDLEGKLCGSTTANANGEWSVSGLYNGTYQASVKYTYKGQEYAATSNAFVIYNGNAKAPAIVVDVPADPGPGPEAVVISGLVQDQNDKPLEGILVLFYDRDGKEIQYVANTDTNGELHLEGVVPGSYQVVYHYAGTIMDIQDIQIAEDAEAYTLDTVTIDTTAKTGYGKLEGIVLDKEGNPVAGANVYVYDESGRKVGYQLTDIEGKYSFTLPEGNYTVVIERPFLNESSHQIPVNDESVNNGTGVENTEVSADSFKISGYANDIDGNPLAGITVYLYDADTDSRIQETLTDTEGYYAFTNLPAGNYFVRIVPGIGETHYDSNVTVAPGSGTTEEGITVTTEHYTLSGTVIDAEGAPVKGATVILLDSENIQCGKAVTGDDGIYRFTGLTEGNYTVAISYPDNEELGRKDVTVEKDEEVNVNAYTVSGSVVDEKGNPLSGGLVVFINRNTQLSYQAMTDTQGIFSITIPNGTYDATASYSGKLTTKSLTVQDADIPSADFTITLNAGGSQGGGGGGGGGGGNSGQNQGETDSQQFVISGIVVDGSGNPVAGADITVTDEDGKTYTAASKKDGSFSLTVPSEHKYTISISYGNGDSVTKDTKVDGKDVSIGKIEYTSLGIQVRAYVSGYPDGSFQGNGYITRAEVAAIVSRVSEGFSESEDYSGLSFTDVDYGEWYGNYVAFSSSNGLMDGYSDGSFAPGSNVTRAEYAAAAARLLGLPNSGDASYTDTDGHWASGYIAQMSGKGIINGYADGSFQPNAPITRSEAVAMMDRALGRSPDTSVLDALISNGTIAFSDVKDKSDWDYYYIYEAAFDHYHAK